MRKKQFNKNINLIEKFKQGDHVVFYGRSESTKDLKFVGVIQEVCTHLQFYLLKPIDLNFKHVELTRLFNDTYLTLATENDIQEYTEKFL